MGFSVFSSSINSKKMSVNNIFNNVLVKIRFFVLKHHFYDIFNLILLTENVKEIIKLIKLLSKFSRNNLN